MLFNDARLAAFLKYEKRFVRCIHTLDKWGICKHPLATIRSPGRVEDIKRNQRVFRLNDHLDLGLHRHPLRGARQMYIIFLWEIWSWEGKVLVNMQNYQPHLKWRNVSSMMTWRLCSELIFNVRYLFRSLSRIYSLLFVFKDKRDAFRNKQAFKSIDLYGNASARDQIQKLFELEIEKWRH